MEKTAYIRAGILGLASALFTMPVSATIMNVLENAGMSSASVSASKIAAPGSILDDNVTNMAMQGFDEAQGVVMTVAYSTDGGGSILAGSLVDSHMIFLYSAGSGSLWHFDVTWSFDGIIIGVMSDQPGVLEAASTNELGSPTTLYPTTGATEPPADPGALPGAGFGVFKGFGARGIEGNNGPFGPFPKDGYLISLDGRSITVGMSVTEPGDWLRVVTRRVPEPTTVLLLGLGLLAIGFRQVRKARR